MTNTKPSSRHHVEKERTKHTRTHPINSRVVLAQVCLKQHPCADHAQVTVLLVSLSNRALPLAGFEEKYETGHSYNKGAI